MFLTFLHSAIRFSTVFIYGSTGETLTEKSGHLNLGIPGVMCFGAVGGLVGERLYLNACGGAANANGFWAVFIPIIFTLIFGAILGLVFSFFTVTLRCNQNVTGLTITTFGVGFNGFYIEQIEKKGFNLAARFFSKGFMPVGENWFGDLFLSYGTLVYLAIIISIIVAIVLKQTRFGLNIKAVGESPATADAAGINVGKTRYLSTMLGSAISALGGLYYFIEINVGLVEFGTVDAYGWLAVALVIFTLWKTDLGIAGAFLFAFLFKLPEIYSLPSAQLNMLFTYLPYFVTIVILVLISIFDKKGTQAPSNLGIPYFREER